MPEIVTPVSSRLFYRKMGAGPVVILLHGFPESSSLWRNIWDELSASFTLIIPDLPGSGGSTLNSVASINQMAACIKAITDKERIDKAVIAGHSMGGYVGFAFAERYPEKVCGLSIVHSTPLPDDEEKKKVRQRSIELMQKGGKKAFISQMVPNLFSASFKQSHPEIVKEQVALALKMEEKGMVNFYSAMMGRKGHTEMLDAAVFPIQWIIGINDNTIYYKTILQFCHKSAVNYVSLYDCGHMSMLETPEKLIIDLKKIVNFSYAHQREPA